jgi:hypothetical protein
VRTNQDFIAISVVMAWLVQQLASQRYPVVWPYVAAAGWRHAPSATAVGTTSPAFAGKL